MSKVTAMSFLGPLALGTTLLFSSAQAAETPVSAQASIAFANLGGIVDWRADGDRGIWIQDVHRHWYLAQFVGTCPGLPFANAVEFAVEPGGDLNRWSYIRVPETGPCYFRSFERGAGPADTRVAKQ